MVMFFTVKMASIALNSGLSIVYICWGSWANANLGPASIFKLLCKVSINIVFKRINDCFILFVNSLENSSESFYLLTNNHYNSLPSVQGMKVNTNESEH